MNVNPVYVFELVLCVSLDFRLCIAITKLSLFISPLILQNIMINIKTMIKARGDEYLFHITKLSLKHQTFYLVVQVSLMVSEI